MNGIHITDIEAAINYWRAKSPSPDGVTLCVELRDLAHIYALMVYHRETQVSTTGMPAKAYAAWLAWYDTQLDTPCIAICSTSQGDAHCKGCGRTFDEVQHWPGYSPAEKLAWAAAWAQASEQPRMALAPSFDLFSVPSRSSMKWTLRSRSS